MRSGAFGKSSSGLVRSVECRGTFKETVFLHAGIWLFGFAPLVAACRPNGSAARALENPIMSGKLRSGRCLGGTLRDYERPETSDEPYDRICDLIGEWYSGHPEPVARKHNPKLKR